MNWITPIILFLFILGAGTQTINEFGIADYSVPDVGLAPIDESGVREIQAGAESTGSSDYSTVEILLLFARVIGSGITAMFTVGPLIYQWGTAIGAPADTAAMIAGLISIPLTVVVLFGLWEMWTGRSSP